jgi:urease accessory protein UreH
MASVTFKAATRVYPGGTRAAVDKLNLEVADGEFLVWLVLLDAVNQLRCECSQD